MVKVPRNAVDKTYLKPLSRKYVMQLQFTAFVDHTKWVSHF